MFRSGTVTMRLPENAAVKGFETTEMVSKAISPTSVSVEWLMTLADAMMLQGRDDSVREAAADRLRVLRSKATAVVESDDETPYDWTEEGLAEMHESLHAAWQTERRLLENE